MDPTQDPNAPQQPGAPPLDPSLAIPNTPNYINPAYATPNQKAQLYAYAQEMMKPQPINNWAQGLSSLAHALMGGYLSHQADVQEQSSQAQLQADIANSKGTLDSPSGAGGNMPNAGSAAPVNGGPNAPPPPDANSIAPAAAGYLMANGGITSPLGAAALAGNFQAESGFNPNAMRPGDGHDGSAAIGLGQWNGPRAQALQQFAAANSLDPSAAQTQLAFASHELRTTESPSLAALNAAQTPEQANAAALGYFRPAGYTAKDPTQSSQYGNRLAYTNQIAATLAARAAASQGAVPTTPASQGPAAPPIAAPSPAASPAPLVPPQHIALANALMGPQPVGGGPALSPQTATMASMLMAPTGPSGNGLPVSAAAIGRVLGNANLPESQRLQFGEQFQPKSFNDALNNTSMGYQNQPVQQNNPIFRGGVLRPQDASSVPAVVGGPLSNPTNTIISPSMAGQPGSGAQPSSGNPLADMNAPGGFFGQAAAAKAQTQAQNDAITTTASKSVDQYTADRATAANYQQTISPTTHAIEALTALGPVGTGPGTAQRNEIASFFQSLAPNVTAALGIDPNKITDFNTANKYLVQMARSNGDTGTNNQLAAAFEGNPNTTVDTATALNVSKTILAMQRMKQAEIVNFQNAVASGHAKPTDYGEYALRFAQSVDPRAFGLDQMTPDAKQKLAAEMPADGTPAQRAERSKFNQSAKLARSVGLMP